MAVARNMIIQVTTKFTYNDYTITMNGSPLMSVEIKHVGDYRDGTSTINMDRDAFVALAKITLENMGYVVTKKSSGGRDDA